MSFDEHTHAHTCEKGAGREPNGERKRRPREKPPAASTEGRRTSGLSRLTVVDVAAARESEIEPSMLVVSRHFSPSQIRHKSASDNQDRERRKSKKITRELKIVCPLRVPSSTCFSQGFLGFSLGRNSLSSC